MNPTEDVLGRLAIFASSSEKIARKARNETDLSDETVEQIMTAQEEAEAAVRMARAEYDDDGDDAGED